MSLSSNALALGLALSCTACGAAEFTGGAHQDPVSYIDLRIDRSIAINGQDIHLVVDDSLIVRATVIGDTLAYARPTLAASDPTAIESRPDGSVRVLRQAALVFTATAAARSSGTQPAALQATGSITMICTMEARAGVTLTIVDSLSGAGISGPGNIRLAVTDGAYTDSLRMTSFYSFWGAAYERSGTYTATVDADGYLPWRKDGIVVTHGLCHVRPVSVTARLVRR